MCNGNGYMSLRASFEFDRLESAQGELYMRYPDNVTLEKPHDVSGKWGIYIPGVVGNHPLLKEEMVNLPYFLGWNLYIDSVKAEISSSIVEFSQQLNYDDGSYQYRLSFSHEQELFHIESFRVADITHKHYHHQSIKILTESKKELMFESFIDSAVTTNGYNHFSEQKQEFAQDLSRVEVRTDKDSTVEILQKVTSKVPCIRKECEGERISCYYAFSGVGSFEKDTFIKTNRESVCNNLKKYKFNRDLQTTKWSAIWDRIDVRIDGDPMLQDAMRLSIYHLYRSKKFQDPFVAIDAKGVAGEGYFGHYFWDTEIYLFPFFLYSDPSAAKELLMFRYHTLGKAKENAKSYGYQGAKYPWESSISGEEQCSNWQYSDFEIHVSFDIVYAIWQYYQVTGDKESMKSYFAEIMIEVSRFIVSRVSIDNQGVYHLKGVMGPDEYLAFTDNNAFTNYLARFTLEKSIEIINTLAINSVSCEELVLFQKIAKELWIPIDRDRKFIWQCDRFDQFETIDFDQIWTDKTEPFGRFISQEKNYRSKALKQADVMTLLALFELDFDAEYMQNCLDYYLPITTHDSSLSYTTHSIIFSKLQQTQKGYEYLRKAVGIDIYNHGAGEGVHIANCGGIYQAVIYGFTGLVNPMHTDGIICRPAMPEHITGISYKISHRGKLFLVRVENNQATVEEV